MVTATPSPTPSQSDQVPDHSDSPREALDHFQKMNLVNAARLMADNQSCLDLTNKRARAFLNHELQMMGQAPDLSKDDEMNIAIDSPTTHNHYTQPTSPVPSSGSAMSPLMKLAAVGLMASGIGIPAGIAAWQLPALLGSAKPAATSLLQDYDLLVGAPPAPPAAKPSQKIPEGP